MRALVGAAGGMAHSAPGIMSAMPRASAQAAAAVLVSALAALHHMQKGAGCDARVSAMGSAGAGRVGVTGAHLWLCALPRSY